MHLQNPLQMNDWENRTFFLAFQALQIAFIGAVFLDLAGYHIPIVREVLAFVYITFLPGTLILKALRLHNLGTIETVLYSVGLSLVVVMITGLFANTAYPLLGYARPFSFEILFLTIVGVMQILLYIALTRDREHVDASSARLEVSMPPPAVPFLALLPFFAIVGTYIRNEYHMVTLLFLLLVLIAVIGIVVGFDRLIPASSYPFAVYTIALALLYHTSLISEYIWGYDIHHELHLANNVLSSGIWDMTIPYNTNGMLSIVMLVPSSSLMCDLDPIWVFKILFPLLFALVPLGLYRAIEKQTNPAIGFFSAFFFFSFFTFYTEMISLARQQIAELFLVLTVLAMIDTSLDRGRRLLLMVTFGLAMIVSHYGLSYIYLFSLIPAWLLLILPDYLPSGIMERLRDMAGAMAHDPLAAPKDPSPQRLQTLVLPYILIFILLTYIWYSTVAGGTALATIAGIGDKMVGILVMDPFNPTTVQGMHILTTQSVTPLHSLAKIVHIATQGLIAVGLLATLTRWRDQWRIEPEYLAISLAFFLINIAGIVVPFFASSLNTSRLYHITLILLAPFAIIGGIAIYEAIIGRIRSIAILPFMKTAFQALSIFFVVFLLFNTGLIYQITGDNPTSMALETSGDKPVFNGREVQGARWLLSEGNERPIYVDGTRWWLLLGFNPVHQRYLPANASLMEPASYLYFGTYNLMRDSVRLEVREHAVTAADYADAGGFIRNQNRIYDNAGSAVYYR